LKRRQSKLVFGHLGGFRVHSSGSRVRS
jgi:hypothetical protein